MRDIWQIFVFFSLTSFVAIKVSGTVLAAWSWWWLLMAPVPFLSLAYSHLGWL